MFGRRNPNLIQIIIEADMTTSEGQALAAAIQALPAAFAAANQANAQQLRSELDAANAALAAEKQDHADDLAAASAAVQAATPTPEAA